MHICIFKFTDFCINFGLVQKLKIYWLKCVNSLKKHPYTLFKHVNNTRLYYMIEMKRKLIYMSAFWEYEEDARRTSLLELIKDLMVLVDGRLPHKCTPQ